MPGGTAWPCIRMDRTSASAALSLALLVLALAAAPAAAQNSTFGEQQLNGTGPVYKKQDSLDPVCSHSTLPSVFFHMYSFDFAWLIFIFMLTCHAPYWLLADMHV